MHNIFDTQAPALTTERNRPDISFHAHVTAPAVSKFSNSHYDKRPFANTFGLLFVQS